MKRKTKVRSRTLATKKWLKHQEKVWDAEVRAFHTGFNMGWDVARKKSEARE